MSDRPFLSERMMNQTIPRLQRRGLETALGIKGRQVTFDRNGVDVGPVDVILTWSNTQPFATPPGTTRVIGTEGMLEGRPGELELEGGEQFVIDGQPAEVTIGTREINGRAVANFVMTRSRFA